MALSEKKEYTLWLTIESIANTPATDINQLDIPERIKEALNIVGAYGWNNTDAHQKFMEAHHYFGEVDE
jgi:hypothetical protein